jgi:hypothetical protein
MKAESENLMVIAIPKVEDVLRVVLRPRILNLERQISEMTGAWQIEGWH